MDNMGPTFGNGFLVVDKAWGLMLSHSKDPYEARPRVGLIPIKPAAKGFIIHKTLCHFFPPWNKKKKIGGF